MLSVLPSSAVSTVLEGEREACWTPCLEALGRRTWTSTGRRKPPCQLQGRQERALWPCQPDVGLGSYLMLAKLIMASCFIAEDKDSLGSSSISAYRTQEGWDGWDVAATRRHFHVHAQVSPCQPCPQKGAGHPCPHLQPTACLPTWTFSASWCSRQKASKLSDMSLHLHSVQMLLRNLIFSSSSW